MRKILIILVGLTLGAGSLLMAQDRSERRELRKRERELRRELTELDRKLNRLQGNRNSALTIFSNRARLGVVVQTNADDEVDSLGALITSVTEGGPADEAGLRAGDIVTSIHGEKLVDSEKRHTDFQSAPGLQLVDIARGLEDGDTVEVEYLRGNLKRRATVVARDLGSFEVFSRSFRAPAPLRIEPRLELQGGEPMVFTMDLLRSDGWLDVELVSLNPGLGKYFGTDDGLLVVSAPDDSELGLRSGDVILNIDGRKPRNVNHVYRILKSYEEGEEVSFDVMRDKKNITVKGKIPERVRGGSYFLNRRSRSRDNL